MQKNTIRLGYGEYFELKVTDASKNIINQVEITPVKLSADLIQWSENSDKVKLGEEWTTELKRGMGDVDDKEFLSWIYVKGCIDKDQEYISPGGADESFDILHSDDIKVPDGKDPDDKGSDDKELGRELKVQVQIERRVLYWNLYYWVDYITIPRVLEYGDEETKCSILINKNQMESMAWLVANSLGNIEIKNWRYKLQSSKINVDKVDKKVFSDVESQFFQGVRSYTYPEGVLIQDSATVGVDKIHLVDKIAQHILSRYRHGRETISIRWQGDPRITIGDSLILTDIMGIEKEYMVTGSQFVLDSNGSFSMNTEGISVVSV